MESFKTDQLVFDRAVRAIKKQGRPSTTCEYECADGSKCIVGLLVSDKYLPQLVGLGAVAYNKAKIAELVQKSVRRGKINAELLNKLQRVHDSNTGQYSITRAFKDDLRNVAKQFNLDDSIVDTLPEVA